MGIALPPCVKCLGGKLAAMLATMLLLLAPSSAMANDGYIVILSDDDNTLTFKAGDETTADNKTCWTLDSWNKDDLLFCGANKLGNKRKTITTVNIDPTFANARPTKTSSWFSELENLEEITGLEYLNTSEATDMARMFYKCKKLSELTFGENFKTDKVESMSSMFEYCEKLKSLNLSKFNTEKVTNMWSMFEYCQELETIDLSKFNTENVTNMAFMFYDCEKLKTITLSENFKTNKVTSMSSMFFRCKRLDNLELNSFNTENVTDMSYMFYECYDLNSLNLSGFNTEKVTNMNSMFYYCSSLSTIDLSKFNTENVTYMGYMFYLCKDLTTIKFGDSFKTNKVTNIDHMFGGCNSLETLDLSGFNTDEAQSLQYMFGECSSLQTLDLSGFNTEKVTNMSDMFANCWNLTDITFGKNFKTDNVTDMNDMFNSCYSLQKLDLSGFNTEKVTNMNSMFYYCSTLKNLNLGNNYFKNATSTSDAFSNINSNCKLTVGAGFDVSVLGTVNTGTYTWEKGQFTLQLALDEDNAVEFAAATESGTAYNTVVLKRTFNGNAWNTLMVPFDISEAEAKTAFGENVKIAKYTGTTLNNNANEDGYEYILNFETSTEGITANEPVFIYGVETTSDSCYTFADKTVTNGTPTKTDESQNVDFVGTYKTGYVPQGNYFIAADNKIYCAANAETNTIKATRATFQPVSDNNEAKTASFAIDGETTGISLPTTAKHVADGTAYNLQGQRVGPGYKGVVIQQGKKYLRK